MFQTIGKIKNLLLYFSKGINRLLEKIDLNKLGNHIAIKVHFGEKGCSTYINPEIVRIFYNKIISSGKKASLVECNILYRGLRTCSRGRCRIIRW